MTIIRCPSYAVPNCRVAVPERSRITRSCYGSSDLSMSQLLSLANAYSELLHSSKAFCPNKNQFPGSTLL